MYETLYVRLNRSFGFGETTEYNEGHGDFSLLSIATPNSEYPDDAYGIDLWFDWRSEDYGSPFQTGSVIPVSLDDPFPLGSPFTVDFYDD